MALHPFLTQIRQLIAEDELPAALQQLHALLENTPKLDEVIQQSGRLADVRKQMRLGMVSFEQMTVTKNQIRMGLLELVSEIEKEGVKPGWKEEVEKAILSINNSKNAVAGSTLQAGGNINIGDTFIQYGDIKIPRHLGSLVSKPALLLGREDDLGNIHQQLQSGQHFLLLVNGMGGMGKTTLAAEYYCRFLPQYTHLAWVFAETGITEALLTLNNKLKLDFPPAMPNSERVMLLMDALRELEGPALLVIDNANDLEELRKHDNILRACPNFRLLLTSRITEFEQASTYPIAPLEKEKAALEVFKMHYTAFENQEVPLFYEVYDAVQGNTLVLEVLAKNLQQHNTKLKKRYQLAELKRDLEKGLSHLSQSKEVAVAYQAKGTGLRHEKPAVILLAMYDLSELNRAESQLLSNFAVLPAEYLPYAILESLLPNLSDLDQLLIALAQKGWLDKNVEEDAFRVNPVVQEVVRVKNEDLLVDCRPLIRSLIEKLDYEGTIGHLLNVSYAEAATYAKLGESVVNAPLIPDYDIANLCERLGSYHRALGNLQRALTFFEQYNTLCEELYATFPQNVNFKNGLATSYSRLGQTHSALGNLQQALTFFEQYNCTQTIRKMWNSKTPWLFRINSLETPTAT
ncbi:NB-ARC domain-containing protein [Haliscomenobacter hydrossis]|uniref:NB-ARC domain protein n=1 Tax=Haliscomenobacter hydrossis (strain ATCC 27775 / DSM 1100 / LMG 10767 / O) TaxID=760192 RepID=F4L4W4_HALH1|nr:NB-ARC domain-containing protein [Haliscomenobacter hydrossis]AEE54026.1 NB-ARC domain protein [Haliscomenobacter hydrossis DSM 1100]